MFLHTVSVSYAQVILSLQYNNHRIIPDPYVYIIPLPKVF